MLKRERRSPGSIGSSADLLYRETRSPIWFACFDSALNATAIAIVRAHRDKSYSLCDALSFVVMEQLRIREAISFDQDFRSYGGRGSLVMYLAPETELGFGEAPASAPSLQSFPIIELPQQHERLPLGPV